MEPFQHHKNKIEEKNEEEDDDNDDDDDTEGKKKKERSFRGYRRRCVSDSALFSQEAWQ